MKVEIFFEQHVAVRHADGSCIRVRLAISHPQIGENPHFGPAWVCYPKLDGLIELHKPAYGTSSFRVIVAALQIVRQLLRDSSKGAKIYLLDDEGSRVESEREISLRDLFCMA